VLNRVTKREGGQEKKRPQKTFRFKKKGTPYSSIRILADNKEAGKNKKVGNQRKAKGGKKRLAEGPQPGTTSLKEN